MKPYWLFALLLTACYRPLPSLPPQVSIDPAFQQYVDSFVADSATVLKPVTINNLIIQFQPALDPNPLGETIGECKIEYYNGAVYGTPLIQIDQPFWLQADEWQRHTLVYHEMGHCVLFRVHRFDWLSIYGPDLVLHYIAASIMYPYVIASADAQMFANYYVSEMFQ
jgi:hypothetical protein